MTIVTLLSPDNAARNAAEQGLDTLQQSQPGQLAMQLIETIAAVAAPPEVRELAAVLLRRRLPVMLSEINERSGMPTITAEWRQAIQFKLLEALSCDCAPRLRRKVCDAVGRVGIEFVADGSWPELMEWVRDACTSGVPTAHEAALAVLSHMAPALVEPARWPSIGSSLQALLLGALSSPGAEVSGAALTALAALLQACAEQEQTADSATERKALKAIATDLQGALPPMLGCLEAAVASADPARVTSVLEGLATVAGAQPRLFKGVLPVVVEGMVQLSTGATLQLEARISCVELLLTLAEGAPKMVTKLEAFTPRTMNALLPMLVRLGGDLVDWEAAEPEDGLLETDDDDDDEKEAAYAMEALERLSDCVGGEALTKLLLPMLQPMLAADAPWNAKHGAFIAIGQVASAGSDILEPHLEYIVGMLRDGVAAAESRLRWASFYCLGLLCDEFGVLGESMHAALVPLCTAGMADACPRVRAAACLAAVNLMLAMEEEDVIGASQPLLGAIHALLASPTSPNYLVYAASASLAVLSDELASAPGKPMAAAYPTLMPLLGQRLAPALAARYGKGAAELLHSMGKLAAASGVEAVAAGAPALIHEVVCLLGRPEVVEDRDLVRAAHVALTALAGVTKASFVGSLEALLPALLASAAIEVDFYLEKVEVEDPAADEADDGYEVQYIQNKGKGFVKLRINSNQMDEKLLALDSLYSYASSLGAHFHPAVRPVVEACLPILTYKFSDKARAGAAMLLGEAYKCVVAAAVSGLGGLAMAHAAELAAAILKPMSEQLNKEDSLEAADAMVDAFREVLVCERQHAVGVMTGPALSSVLQLTKRQLQLDEKRVSERAAAAAERDEDDEDDEENKDNEEAELLTSCAAVTIEVLRQHGAAALPQVEAQLLPHMQPWLAATIVEEEGAITRLALGLDVVAALIEHTGRDAGKKFVTAVLPLLHQHLDSADARLRRSAVRVMGVVAEHGGKLLSRKAEAEVASKLVAALQASDARYSTNIAASEAAAASIGRMLLHRPAALDAASVLPVWLHWLPLRHSADDAPIAMACLCQMLEADASAVFGDDNATFPTVLGAMAAAYGNEDTTDAVSMRLKTIVSGWAAANHALLASGTAALPQTYLRDKVGRMVTV